MYTCILLDDVSADLLRKSFLQGQIAHWNVKCHHMTIHIGPANDMSKPYLGKTVELTVKSFAVNSLVCAVGVETEVPSVNKIKHITLAVNEKSGGKPKMSNDLTNWLPVDPLILYGTVTEVK